jgi:hypothetical protein
MPAQPPGSYQTVGTLLKVMGWLNVVGVAFLLLAAVVMLVLAIFLGGAGAAVSQFDDWGPWAGLGGALAGALFVGLFIFMLVLAGIAVAFLFWVSWIYAKWTAFDGRAPGAVFVYAIVVLVFAGIGLLGALGGFDPVSLLLNGAQVAIAILLLVNSRKPDVLALFGRGAPAAGTPTA